MQVPVFSGITPCFGPMSGGTNITLRGVNLDIGSSREIRIGNSWCEIYSVSNTTIECTTNKSEVMDETFPLELKIDETNVPVKPLEGLCGNFSYKMDPLIDEIFPTTATFRFDQSL